MFFRLIGRPVVAPTLDVQTGMRKHAEAFGDPDQARAKKLVRQGVAHLALKTDFDGGVAVELAMSGIDRQHDMNQLMDEDAENLDRIGDVGANNDFKVGVFGRRTMPAFANARAAPTRGREGNGEANIFRNLKTRSFQSRGVAPPSPNATSSRASREYFSSPSQFSFRIQFSCPAPCF